MKILMIFFLIVSGVYYFILPGQKSVDVPKNFLIKDTPAQRDTVQKPFKFKGYQITPLADFVMKGRILSYKTYSSDREADLSPIDLALGWGPMSKNEVLSKIDISQRSRWYYWRTDNFPIPRRDIETNSANMHIIPADKSIAGQLKDVKRGQIVHIKGHLVECNQNGWKWKSSLSREDTGGGACEVIYVTNLKVTNPSN